MSQPTQKIKVIDFRHVPQGTVVVRSEHYKKNHWIKPFWRRRKQLGIIEEIKFFDEDGRIASWPVVHWEGELFGTLCHPALVDLYRKVKATYTEINA